MPGTDALHSALTGTNIHVPYRFTYADEAAREAEAGAVPTDMGCLALQQDDNSLWILTDDDPLTWVAVADAGGTTQAATINFVFDGGGDPIAANAEAWVEIPYACNITRVTMLADQAATAVIDLWKDAYANYPPTDADSITSATPPTITAVLKSEDTTLTSWTIALAAGDVLLAHVDSNDVAEQITLSVKIERS